MDLLQSCAVLTAKARELQLIPDKVPRDHKPLLACFNYQLFFEKDVHMERWDQEKVRMAHKKGWGREQFLRNLEELSLQNRSAWGSSCLHHTPDEAWEGFVQDMQTAAKQFKKGEAQKAPARVQDWETSEGTYLLSRDGCAWRVGTWPTSESGSNWCRRSSTGTGEQHGGGGKLT